MAITLLLVDDSKLARIVAGRTIEELHPDWVRIEASGADEALQISSQSSIDVAILDFNMPGKDGLELASEVRDAYPNMPIAIVTANIQDEIIARARAVNASFVTKPITPEGIGRFLDGAALRLRQTKS